VLTTTNKAQKEAPKSTNKAEQGSNAKCNEKGMQVKPK
jgi:hypothetical protein